jgi:hypothetical protein
VYIDCNSNHYKVATEGVIQISGESIFNLIILDLCTLFLIANHHLTVIVSVWQGGLWSGERRRACRQAPAVACGRGAARPLLSVSETSPSLAAPSRSLCARELIRPPTVVHPQEAERHRGMGSRPAGHRDVGGALNQGCAGRASQARPQWGNGW